MLLIQTFKMKKCFIYLSIQHISKMCYSFAEIFCDEELTFRMPKIVEGKPIRKCSDFDAKQKIPKISTKNTKDSNKQNTKNSKDIKDLFFIDRCRQKTEGIWKKKEDGGRREKKKED